MNNLNEWQHLEQKKILELFESLALLLQSDLIQWMDEGTYGQLTELRNIVQSWVQGESTLSHEEFLQAITTLTVSLSQDKTLLFDPGNQTVH